MEEIIGKLLLDVSPEINEYFLPLRQRMKEELDWNICQITQSIYLTTYT